MPQSPSPCQCTSPSATTQPPVHCTTAQVYPGFALRTCTTHTDPPQTQKKKGLKLLFRYATLCSQNGGQPTTVTGVGDALAQFGPAPGGCAMMDLEMEAVQHAIATCMSHFGPRTRAWSDDSVRINPNSACAHVHRICSVAEHTCFNCKIAPASHRYHVLHALLSLHEVVMN